MTKHIDLGDYFQNWLAKQSEIREVIGSFRVSMANFEVVRQAIKAAGGELIE